MSEEEIIKYIKDEIESDKDTMSWFEDNNNATRKDIEECIEAHQGLLDLYQKEKDRNIELSTTIDALTTDYKEEKEKNEELETEKRINAQIIYLANNTICSYHEGYQAGLHKETTATEIVAEEKERFLISQEIKRLKDTIYELHNKLDEGNKKVEKDYISKDKIKELIKEIDDANNDGDWWYINKIEELLEERK